MLKQEKRFGFLTLSPRLRTHSCYELSFLDSVTALRLGSLGQQCGAPQLRHEFTRQPSPAVLIILVFAACLAEECMQPRCWWILCRSPLLVSSIKLSLSNFPRKARGKKYLLFWNWTSDCIDAPGLLAVNCRKYGTILGREQEVTERAAMQLTHWVGIPAVWIKIIYVVAMSKMAWALSKHKKKTKPCTQELENNVTDRHVVKAVSGQSKEARW